MQGKGWTMSIWVMFGIEVLWLKSYSCSEKIVIMKYKLTVCGKYDF